MSRTLAVEQRAGELRYRFLGRVRRPAPGESLAACCVRLAVEEVELPTGETWCGPVVRLVLGVSSAPLPPSVRWVRVGDLRFDLGSALGASAWRFVVAALAARSQRQSTTKAALPTGRPPAKTTASAPAKSVTVPSGRRTTSRAGHRQDRRDQRTSGSSSAASTPSTPSNPRPR